MLIQKADRVNFSKASSYQQRLIIQRVTDDCIAKFEQLKLKKAYKYILYKVNTQSSSIVVDKTGPSNASDEDFIAAFPTDECRYAVYSTTAERILFINFPADGANMRSKMILASSRDTLRRRLAGVQKEYEATDLDELKKAIRK
ncbi:related to Actin-depolymerizing factor 1 [Ramularia collo-cygni]|uniref:Cofilin n=1 Tax=Ramularia collo-cygni TaxID=112498 RepID=A0A2D3V076_9PEZI|nr:related to Actin-depolymerizing factor 1 [Ramularia collo-cygni]CZT22766.1 related to Actin-depolymerizing factor 1 [Ramularia collo-cygni]